MLERFRGVRDRYDALNLPDVVGILHDCPVPIEEDSTIAGVAVHRGRSLPKSRIAAKNVVSQPVCQSGRVAHQRDDAARRPLTVHRVAKALVGPSAVAV